MADLGDVSVVPLWDYVYHSLDNGRLADKAMTDDIAAPFAYGLASENEPAGNVCTITCATGTVVTILQEGSLVRRSASVAGEAKFYGLPNGVMYAHAAGSTQTWRVTVAGTSVTVEELSGAAAGLYLRPDGRFESATVPPSGGRLVAYTP